MYREIAGTDEQVRAIPGVRDRRVRATKVRMYFIQSLQKQLALLNAGQVRIWRSSTKF